ncbi:MAG: amidophosphoribosyltransferase [Bacteroidaceae bacterium]|nr:amidophosphoribosyltransferase [Bacteroidaceae bacterium]
MEELKHECGVAMIRLLKPPTYYQEKYGTGHYGLNKLYLMMEKQHNRGQEGAGIACVNLDAPVGEEYMFRERAEGKEAITEIFKRIENGKWTMNNDTASECAADNFQLSILNCQLMMGHLRYSTTGKSGLQYVHPFLRRNNWRAKNLCLCGNFNMTNIDEIFTKIVRQGQSPRMFGDSYITLEWMGHRLDREVERNFEEAKNLGLKDLDITHYIDDHVDMARVLRTSLPDYDGGYVLCGLTGSGEMFAVRDPWGIRPVFFYQDDEVVAVASERPVLQTTFDLTTDQILELLPGEALIVNKHGRTKTETILPQRGDSQCSFERIYFSRGSDRDIYQERKRLGEQLTKPILRAIDLDTEHTVFSFIPNTAEVAFYGMVEGFRRQGLDVRTEKVAWKDIKLRTFITEAGARNDLAAHVYDITYGCLEPYKDNLVIIDDSIVRGTTLKESIFKILDRLHPKKIVMVSSSPQVRYPDFYGIDMARLEELCAFRAAIALLEETPQIINEVYQACKEHPSEANHVRRIYEPFTIEEINAKMVEMMRPKGMEAPVELVFQSIEGLHTAIPKHHGDWYFTGHYPTPGGIRRVNEAFIDFYENRNNVISS